MIKIIRILVISLIGLNLVSCISLPNTVGYKKVGKSDKKNSCKYEKYVYYKD